MGRTSIAWCTDSLNPGFYGCTVASPACDHCYAAKMAHRFAGAPGNPYAGSTKLTKAGPHWSGQVTTAPLDEAIERIRRFRRPRDGSRPRAFVTSMGDILHEHVDIRYTAALVCAMAERPDVDWLLLTKRARRWEELADFVIAKIGRWPANVWAGVTVEDRKRLEDRAYDLAKVPAAVRWWSCEPLLGDLGELRRWLYPTANTGRRGVNWIITGNESGARARPSSAAWFRSIRDQATEAGVAYFHKQGAIIEGSYDVGPARQGRAFDGRTWDELPEVSRG